MGALLGFIGLIVALPLTTLIIAYYQRYVTKEDIARPVPSAADTPPETAAGIPETQENSPKSEKQANNLAVSDKNRTFAHALQKHVMQPEIR